MAIPAFGFRCGSEIVFGRGVLARLGTIASSLGRRAFIVHGNAHLSAAGQHALVRSMLDGSGIHSTSVGIRGEPDVETVDAAAGLARAGRTDLVIGIGGGSVIDAAKAVSGLISNPGNALDYMEVVGKGRELESPAVPLVAVPTTSGTGTEVTRNAVMTSREPAFKASMRSQHLVPRVALVDPALTDSLPPGLTATTGLDALTQLIESRTSSRSNPVTAALAVRGIRLCSWALGRAFGDGADTEARDAMSLAALLSGICLSNSGLGAVHGLAAPLGAAFPVPHGAACAILLPGVMEANVKALRTGSTSPGTPGEALAAYAEVCSALCGSRAMAGGVVPGPEQIDEGLRLVRELVTALGMPRLGSFGLTSGDVRHMARLALSSSSMKGNPDLLT